MIGFGLIGCGRISDKHIRSLASCKVAELVALCDIQRERMEEAALAYRARADSDVEITLYDDVDLLLKDERVSAVVIATHSASHAELATRALDAGKHIVLEKPIALGTDDARKIAEMAEAKGLIVQVCHQLRYRPVMQRIRQLVEDGSLGKLCMVHISIRLQRSRQYYEEARWRGTWLQDGGMLLNQGIHLIDLMQWFLGDARSVYGQMKKMLLTKQTEDAAVGVVQFGSGGIGVIEANTISHPNNYDNEIALFGEKGTIIVGGIKLDQIRRWHCTDGSLPPGSTTMQKDEHLAMYDCFVKAVYDKEQDTGNEVMLEHSAIGLNEASPGKSPGKDASSPIIDAREGSKALEIIFALYESVRKRREVSLPLDSFATSMMTEWEDE